MKEFVTSNMEFLIAGLALLVSALSVTITLYWNRRTFKHQVKHDQLSVRPIIDFAYDYSNDEIKIFIYNTGTGPLILKTLKFILDGNECSELDFMLLESKFSGQKKYIELINLMRTKAYFGLLNSDCVIPIQGKRELYFFDYKRCQIPQEMIVNVLASVKMKVDFLDIYNNEYHEILQ